jgi:hypothetical protein
MDNGLIFPYPRAAAQAGPGDAKPGTPPLLSGGRADGRTEPAVGEPEG